MKLKQLFLKTIGAGINAAALISADWGGALAFKVFGTPPKPRIRPKEAKFLETATRLDFDFEGKRIAVYGWSADPDFDWQLSNIMTNEVAECSDNIPAKPWVARNNENSSDRSSAIHTTPYVFLAYGWGYNSGRWRYFVPPLLEAGLNVIAYDPRGHGNSEPGLMEYPMMVRMQSTIIRRFGRAKYFLGHSFGGGGMVGTMGALPLELHPDRVCLMGIFSDARWIFHNYRNALGLSRRSYLAMTRRVIKMTGRRLSTFDNARYAARLGHVQALLIHDPADDITSFSNAIRNHQYWPGSWLYEARGAGHHLSTAEVTRTVMDWLLRGAIPASAHRSSGFSQAEHELHTYFIPVEQDWLHGEMRSGYYA